MKPLTANLKHLYQSSYTKMFQLITITITIFEIFKFGTSDIPLVTLSVPFIFFSFLYGQIIGFMITDTLSKPFAFCLPGHIKIVQKMLSIIWLLLIIIYSFSMEVLCPMGIKSDYVLFIGSIGLISLSYWLGATEILGRGKGIRFGIFIVIMLHMTGRIKFIDALLIAHPWVLTFISVILSYFIYRAVSRKDNVRRLCTSPLVGFFAYKKAAPVWFKQERMRRSQDQRFDRSTELDGNFFSKHIRLNQNSMLLAHLWGQVYLSIGPHIARWRTILVIHLCFWILISLIFIATPQGLSLFMFHLIVFIFLSLFFSTSFEYNRFNHFLLTGRKGHFWRKIVSLFTVVLILLGFMTAFVLLLNLLSGSLLPIIFESKLLIPQIKWTLLIVPIIMLPLFGGLVILFRKPMLILYMLIMFFVAVGVSFYAVNAMENTPFMIDLLIILSAVAITWGFHLAVLYYDSMKRSLC